VQDCSAAAENILLAAHALGLGAVWVGLYPKADRTAAMQKLLGLPEQVIPLALIPLGHPAQPVPPEDRFKAGRIHRERW
jgi:nitroreductase